MEKQKCNVFFIFLIPEGEGTILWEGLLGWIALARYWELIKERWSWTGSILVSSCKWSIEVILTQPVAMQRAEFWIVWSFWIRDGGVGELNGSLDIYSAYIQMKDIASKIIKNDVNHLYFLPWAFFRCVFLYSEFALWCCSEDKEYVDIKIMSI